MESIRLEPKTAPQEYELQPGERAILQALNMNALNAKARIYDLQVELEQVRAQLTGAQQAFSGAITVMASAHGMGVASVTPEMDKLVATTAN